MSWSIGRNEFFQKYKKLLDGILHINIDSIGGIDVPVEGGVPSLPVVIQGGATSGGSSVGAGGITVGYQKGGYTFDASAQTITLTGFPTILESQIASVINLTEDITICSPGTTDLGCSISSNVITLDYDTTAMADGDTLSIKLEYNNSEDYSSSSKIVSELSPLDAHNYVAPIEISDGANGVANLTMIGLTADKRHNADIQISTNIQNVVKIYNSNDPDADASSTAGWEDITLDVTTGATIAAGVTGYWRLADSTIGVRYKPDKILIENTPANATNTLNVYTNLTSM